jgi:hypothetical protein
MRRAAVLACALAIAACTGSTASQPPDTSSGTIGGTIGPTPSTDLTGSTTVPPNLEVDLDPFWRTAPELRSIAAFGHLAATGVGGRQVDKFSITEFFGEPNIA